MAKKAGDIIQRQVHRIKSDDFYLSDEWRSIRYQVLLKYGSQCQCCGARPPFVEIHVDHIKPISKFPGLALDMNNLQVLCLDCNFGKSNIYTTDHRKQSRRRGDGVLYGALIHKSSTEDLDSEEKEFVRRYLHTHERRK